jgi:hypothetical protein
MSNLVLIDEESNKRREEVAELMMQGRTPRSVAMQLHMKIVEVNAYWAEHKQLLADDMNARDAAREHLNRMVKHYDGLIRRYYDLLKDLQDEAFGHQIAAQINSALSQIAKLEKERVDALQKAGLLDANDLGDELAEREQREAIIIDILRSDLCPECQKAVRHKLSKLTGQVEGTVQDG